MPTPSVPRAFAIGHLWGATRPYPDRPGVSSGERQWWRHGRLPLPKLRNDTLNRSQGGHVDWQTLINLQFHKPVSNDIHDLVGVGDIHCRHEVDSLGVKPFLDDEARPRKTL